MLKIQLDNIKKPHYLNYDKIDNHYQEVQKLKEDITNLEIPDDLIPLDFNSDMQDLQDERLKAKDEK